MKLGYLYRPVYAARLAAYKLYELRHSDEPWIAPGAVRFCIEHLDRQGIGLEWGSGRSTIWFGERLKSLISVEHDLHWHSKIKRQLEGKGYANVDYRYVPLNHDRSEPTVPYYENLPDYVRVAEECLDESLDFVVVDGHYRQACILAALPKIKTGGLLLVDNTNWLPLGQWQVPSAWPIVHQSANMMTETTIWQKPRSAALTTEVSPAAEIKERTGKRTLLL